LGLHWLLGLVRLAQDDVEEALAEFDREVRLADPQRLYGCEYAMNAWHARGLALLRASRGGDARAALERALELYPNHAQSLVALGEFEKADGAIAILKAHRPIEAAMVSAQLLTARGRPREALDSLYALLGEAPPGFAIITSRD
jgi:tetratricopeptide (TPR) repeat protein